MLATINLQSQHDLQLLTVFLLSVQVSWPGELAAARRACGAQSSVEPLGQESHPLLSALRRGGGGGSGCLSGSLPSTPQTLTLCTGQGSCVPRGIAVGPGVTFEALGWARSLRPLDCSCVDSA